VCLALALQAWALDPARTLPEYTCRTWRQDNGLPTDVVRAITQTQDGYIWLGTSKGLVRFDGGEFRSLSPAQQGETEDPIITTLAPRSAGGLWYGLERGSFGYFDGKRFHSLKQADWGGPYLTVRTVREAHDGTLLIGAVRVAGRMVNTNQLDSFRPNNLADVFSLLEDPKGRIWIGTAEHGLFYWQAGRLTPFPDPTLRNMVISSLAMDATGCLWVGTASGPRRYDEEFQPKALGGGLQEPKAMLVDRHGILWLGTAEGLARYQNGTFSFFRRQDGLAGNRVLALFEDKDGSLWVGTVEGVSQLSDPRFPTLSASEGLAAETCLAVAASPMGGIWAGTPNGASCYHDGQFTSFGVNGENGFRSRWVKRVFVARNGDAYFIGARKNLDRFSGDSVVTSWTNSAWPTAVAEDSQGILVALAGDLMRIEHGDLVPFRLADGSDVSLKWIQNILVARDNSIWLASVRGIFQIKNGMLVDWCQQCGVAESAFFYLCEDDSGAIWSTRNSGLARFNNRGIKFVTREQGLHENFIYAIVTDTFGGCWMDSNHGIFRVSQSELNAVADGLAPRLHCDVYEGQDAVKTTDKAAQEYSGCRSMDGRIWFPSSKGLIVIDPAHVPRDSQPPPVYLEHVRINGREFSTEHEPVLDPGPGNLEFSYSAVAYLAPEKVRYRYRLQGYDADWMEAGGRRSAFYTNLKPGPYRFLVQACNSDGAWNTAGASFPFKLPPRLYQTLAFRIACPLAALGFVVYFWWVWHLRRRQAQLQKAHALMEIKVGERTAELAQANATLRREIEERQRAQAETERLQSQLLDASRRAGQAEVASSVLHNVGNVLNSVNISTSLVTDRLRKMRLPGVLKTANLLAEHAADLARFLNTDERGRRLPAYLGDLGRHLVAEQQDLLEELSSLGQHVEHIKEIVAMQQSYARFGGVLEKVDLAELTEMALKMDASSYARHGVKLLREFEATPPVMVDKHKVLQILGNLARNAKQACRDSAQPEKRVVVRIRRSGPDRVRIEVADNGVGIAAEDQTRVFSYGFTTRKDGHGFGLHSSALAAKEMGGTLIAQSDGKQKGACFVLELPLQPPAHAPAAPAAASDTHRKRA